MSRKKLEKALTNQGDIIFEQVILEYLDTGSVKQTAEKLSLSVVKVRRILITESIWTSKSSAAIGGMYARGKTVSQIANALCMTEKNVQAYIPYSRGVYNGDNRSVSALNSEDYRNRIRIAKQRTLKRIEEYNEEERWNHMNKYYGEQREKRNQLPDGTPMYVEQFPGIIAGREFPEEALQAATKKHGRFELIRLHLELMMDWKNEKTREEGGRVLHKYGDVKYGNEISRDIIVPADIPLYALHYVIQRAFGWENSHLHHFELPQERYKVITGDKAKGWMSLLGVLFRSPLMDDADRFWADDYEDGSFKTWLRKKYRGPYLSLCHGEGYQQCKKDLEYIKKRNGKIRCEWAKSYEGEEYLCDACQIIDNIHTSSCENRDNTRTEELELEAIPVRALDFMFENYPGMLLERLPIKSLLALGDMQLIDEHHPMADCEEIIDSYEAIIDYAGYMIRELDTTGIDSPELQPEPAAATDELLYNYDYGDNWKVKITGSYHCADLIESKRVTQEEIDAAILQVWTNYRPVCIAKDGCNLVDDVGGIDSFIQFLRAINDDMAYDNGTYEDKEGSLEWAKSLGWSKRKISNKSIL